MWTKDNFIWGMLIGVASSVLCYAIIYGVFMVCNLPLIGSKRFFLLAFIPGIIIMRLFVKPLHCHKTAKGILVTIFVLLSVLIVYLVKSHELLAIG